MSAPDPARLPGAALADLLSRHRRAAGLTQEELAAASGISARAISDMERGRVRGPQHRTVQALADALGLAEPARWEFFRAAKGGRARTEPAGAPPRSTDTDPALGTPPPADPAAPLPGQPGVATIMPRRWELPPEVADLTGRDAEVAQAREVVAGRPGGGPGAAAVITVFGPPGVGKTALAVHLGHRLAERYPDGGYFLDLRGTEPNPLTPAEALDRMLGSLGTAEIPTGTDERAALYRSLLRDRRVLIVLDNAANEEQVRPLLPSGPGSLVLVTSQRVLAGLESVHRLPLGVLRPADSRRLLASIVGERRVAAEATATAAVANLCGHLPLALRIAGNRLASRPKWMVESLVQQLADGQTRLSALTAGDLQVRTVFDVSYRQCRPPTRAVFRRLALLAGPGVSADLAAAAAGLDHRSVRRCLEELVDASLLDADAVEDRYVLHDLLRLFAVDRLTEEEPAAAVGDAERRVAARVLATADRAGRLLWPSGATERDPDAAVNTAEEAARWLDLERPQWTATLRAAVADSRHAEVLAVAHAMHWYSDIRPWADLWREVFGYGVAAARALGRRRDEAIQLNFLGWALNRVQGLHRDALAVHEQALQAARDAGDQAEQGWALHYCGCVELDLGNPDRAARLLRPAIDLFAATGDPYARHSSLSFLGVALHGLGRWEQALSTHRQACAFFRRADTVAHRNSLSVCLLRLADTHAATGDWTAAYGAYRESGAVAARARAQVVEAYAWAGCGSCRAATGDRAAALDHFGQALRIFTALDDRGQQARVLSRLAGLTDDPVQAAAYQRRAADLDVTGSRRGRLTS
jgi:transcriptional regulator with XRE-family HTH domain/tetratricopeptide (TPR) repeat protein